MAHEATTTNTGGLVVVGADGSTLSSLTQRFGHTINIVDDYNAAGDGIADDTTKINQAIADLTAAGGQVYFPPGTYLISHTSTVAFSGIAAQRYCILAKANVLLVLDPAATIKLANTSNSGMIVNDPAASGVNMGVVGGTLDGNRTNQSAPAAGENAGIMYHNATGAVVRDVKFINQHEYAMYTGGVYKSHFENLQLDTAGKGFHFGNHGTEESASLRCADSYFNDIKAENLDAATQANAFIFVGDRCYIGSVISNNTTNGIKIQNGTSDCYFDYLSASNSTSATGAGVKIQGASGLHVTHCSFGTIHSDTTDQYAAYVFRADDINIGSIIAKAGGQATALANVHIGDNVTKVNIDSIYSDNADDAGVEILDEAVQYINIGQIMAKNSSQTAAGNSSNVDIWADNVTIGRIISIDDQTGVETVRHAVRIRSTADNVHIGTIDCTGSFVNETYMNDSTDLVRVDCLRINGDEYYPHTATDTIVPDLGNNHQVDTSAGVITLTVGDGTYLGQPCRIWLETAGNNLTISVTTHETSSPEVFTMATAGNYLSLEWSGAAWVTVKNFGATT